MTGIRASTIATTAISNDRAAEGSCLGRCRWKAGTDEGEGTVPLHRSGRSGTSCLARHYSESDLAVK